MKLFLLIRSLRRASFVEIERFSIERFKPKTKEIPLVNYTETDNPMNQSELKANSCSRRQGRQTREAVFNWFYF